MTSDVDQQESANQQDEVEVAEASGHQQPHVDVDVDGSDDAGDIDDSAASGDDDSADSVDESDENDESRESDESDESRESGEDDDDESDEDEVDPLVEEGDIAGDYLERLLDILDVDGDIDLDVEGSRAVVAVEGGDLAHLVGAKGQTLDALQELTRLAVAARTGTRSRLMLDIDGYRAGRRTSLTELAERTSRDVIASGEAKRLAPMNPFERKVVHDAVAKIDGVSSESDGEEPSRRVVISPA